MCFNLECHKRSLHPGRGQHSKTIAVPQENPWPDLLNLAEDLIQLNQEIERV